MSRIIDLVDLVVAGLNLQTWTVPFTATRTYRPVFDLKDMTTLRVSVVPKALVIAASSRASSMRDLVIDIGVQKKLIAAGQVDMDDLMDTTEEIETYLRANRVFGNAMWTGTENSPVFSQEHLADLRQFTSVLTVTYRQLG